MKKTILIVEDETLMIEELSILFDMEGFNVVSAVNGLLAFRAAQEYKPDLILCDIMMPEQDGFWVLNKIRSDIDLRSTPFIFLTAYYSEMNLRRAIEAGADDFLTKPFTVSNLLNSVLTAFRKRELTENYLSKIREVDVFLSYSRKDIDFMKRISGTLVDSNLKIWTDEYLAPGTANWEQSIVEIMKKAGCLVVILTPEAEHSKWVSRELAMAETLNIHIFPILARGSERNAIPLRLISHQHVDVRHNYDEGMKKLITSIRQYLKLE